MKKAIVLLLLLLLSTITYAQSYKELVNQQFFKDAEKGYLHSMYHYKNENLNIQNEDGETPLIIAVKNKRLFAKLVTFNILQISVF